MKTHFFLMSTVMMLGVSLFTTGYAANSSEYLHFTRHRDSNGNLLMAPTQHKPEPSIMQKTVMPSQPKTFERRSTDWGMTVQEVKENEPVTPTWELQRPVLADYEKRVAYHTQIEGIDAALTYAFYQGHLGQAKYVFEPKHEDAVGYVDDFHTVKNWISESYGSPASVEEIWLDELYQYDKSLWGQAVKRGHLVMVAEWENPGTDIVLLLNGGDDTIGLVADFSSTSYVVPVGFDGVDPAEDVEEAIQEATIYEALPSEPEQDLLTEDLSEQESATEIGGNGEFEETTEVVAQTYQTEIQELEEIEAILMDTPDEMWLEDSFDDLDLDDESMDEHTQGSDVQSDEDLALQHL